MRLEQESLTGQRTVTWYCGREDCTFTSVTDVSGMQPGDHVELPEINAHIFDVHHVRRYVGTSTGREQFTAFPLADLAVDDSE